LITSAWIQNRREYPGARATVVGGLWDAQMDDGAPIELADWDLAAQPAPDYDVDQRINW
jgi:hypothetical protein